MTDMLFETLPVFVSFVGFWCGLAWCVADTLHIVDYCPCPSTKRLHVETPQGEDVVRATGELLNWRQSLGLVAVGIRPPDIIHSPRR